MCEFTKERFLLNVGSRPVRLRPHIFPEDLQALPPYGWCRRCGGEVYLRGRALCFRCKGGDSHGTL